MSADKISGAASSSNGGPGPSLYATRSTTQSSRKGSDCTDENYPRSRRDKTSSTTSSAMEDAAAMILSKIDGPSHERALTIDSETLLQNYVLPRSFPWQSPKVPLSRTAPRDIDDIPGICYAGEEFDILSTFGLNRGSFGYGSFDQGKLYRRDKSSADIGVSSTLKSGSSNNGNNAGSGLSYHEYNSPKSPRKENTDVGNSIATKTEDANTTNCTKSLDDNNRDKSDKHSGKDSILNVSLDEDNEVSDTNIDTDINLEQSILPESYYKIYSAARRSQDPGVIELSVMLPPPSSVQSALVKCKKDGILPWDKIHYDKESVRKAKALIEGERAEMSSCMPLHWSKVDEEPFFNPPAFPKDEHSEGSDLYTSQNDSNTGTETCIDETLYEEVEQNSKRKEKVQKMMKSCIRRWSVSVKVGNVSSRSSLFKSPISNANAGPHEACPKHQASSRLPLLATASFPPSIQSGKSVSLGMATQMDAEGLATQLGSYDCRTFSAFGSSSGNGSTTAKRENSKKDSGGKFKRVNIGRTRLIWTGLKTNESNKVSFISHLTGRKLDASSYKRPRDVQVSVRLNGNLLSESDGEMEDGGNIMLKIATQDLSQTTASDERHAEYKSPGYSNNRSGKGSNTITSKANNSSKTETDLDEAIRGVYEDNIAGKRSDEIEFNSSNVNRVVHNKSNSTCTLDTQAYLKELVESTKAEQKASNANAKKRQSLEAKNVENRKSPFVKVQDDYVPMNYGGMNILKFISPQFMSVPLDDGFLRVDCKVLGTMQGSSVNNILNIAARKVSLSGEVCSVCWTGNEAAEVLECGDCGLLVHLECCNDEGEFVDVISDQTEPHFDAVLQPEKKTVNSKMWRCSVCQDSHKETRKESPQDDEQTISSRKSRRTSRIPSRFTDSPEAQPKTLLHKKNYKPRPSHKCTLCPHSGGAMSKDKSNPKRWTHEICRVWSRISWKDFQRESSEYLSFQQKNPHSLGKTFGDSFMCGMGSVCVICGMGDVHNKGREKEEILQCFPPCSNQVSKPMNQERNIYVPGLTKCAARGCSVTFHPLCAVLATKLRTNKNQDYLSHDACEEIKRGQKDKELCQDYTLKLVQLKRTEGAYGNLPGVEKSCIIPLAFCGIHNPRRQESYYGCPPAAELLSKCVTIPRIQTNTNQLDVILPTGNE